MKLPILNFLSKSTEEGIEASGISPSLWQWPYYCSQLRTLSFPSPTGDTGHFFRTANTAYSIHDEDLETEAKTTLLEEAEEADDDSIVEMAVQRVRSSERLFFGPGKTSSILEESNKDCEMPSIEESLVLSMESRDPYMDFRKSMEEMVKAYGLKDWEGLKSLLYWYLRVNGKANHGHILGAFVEMLVDIQAQEAISYPSTSTAHQFSHYHHHDYTSSPMSSSPPPLSLNTEGHGGGGGSSNLRVGSQTV